MLCLTRRIGERIALVCGKERIEIRLHMVGRDRAVLAIDAPNRWNIVRCELETDERKTDDCQEQEQERQGRSCNRVD